MDTSKISKHLNDIDPNLLSLLKETGAILSGSTVLYFVMIELGLLPKFQTTDLDFYITKRHGYNKFNLWFDQSKEKGILDSNLSPLTVSCHLGFICKPIPKDLTEYIPPPHSDSIAAVRWGKINNTKIDLIILHPRFEDPFEYIEEYFDLDICKCGFDGNKFILPYLDNIKSMSCLVKSNHLSFNSKICILDFPEYEDAIINSNLSHSDPLNYIKRIDKYKSREFDVKIDSHFKLKTDLEISPNGLEKYLSDKNKYKSKPFESYRFILKDTEIKDMYKNEIFSHHMVLKYSDDELFKMLFNKYTRFSGELNFDMFLSHSHQDKKYDILVETRNMSKNNINWIFAIALEIKSKNEYGDDETSWVDGKCETGSYKYKIPELEHLMKTKTNEIVSKFIKIEYPKDIINLISSYF